MPRITTKDGGTIAYRDQGQGKPIVFLHGWGTGSIFFQRACSELAGRYRVIAPDFRGHGQSSELPEGDGMTILAEDTIHLLDKLDLDDVVLCGWSMGAMVIWKMLADYGNDRIRGLVIIDMSPKVPNSHDWNYGLTRAHGQKADLEHIRTAASLIFKLSWPEVCKSFIPRIFTSDGTVNPDLVTESIRNARNNNPKSMQRLWNSLILQDYRASLSRIKVPVLVIFGAKSRLYEPETSKWVSEQIPECRRICFEHSGHAPHLEQPEQFNLLVQDFADMFQEKAPGDHSSHERQYLWRF